MKFQLPVLILSSALLMTAGTSSADQEKKGYGAGGVRAEHASEQGIEKGKAWAGSKDEKPTKEKKEKKEKKQKKEKKEKKEEKDK